jgi:Skp family chaperone for outer membrane proteins
LQVVISAGFEDDPEERKLREEADQQLRDKVNKFNDDLKKMIAEGCPKVEINEFIRQKTEELRPRGCGYGVPLKQPKPRFSNKDISLAVKRVAQRLKLDVVLDSNRIFYGGQSLVNGAMDITHDVVNELITTTKR